MQYTVLPCGPGRLLELVLAIPTFHREVVKAGAYNAVRRLVERVGAIAFFVSAQACNRRGECIYPATSSTVSEHHPLFGKVRQQFDEVAAMLETLSVRPEKISIILHTELRAPLWHEEGFRKLYAVLLEKLPAYMRGARIEPRLVDEVLVELHPGFPERGCWRGRRRRDCYNVGMHARMMRDVIDELRESCPSSISCRFTLENRSSSVSIDWGKAERLNGAIRVEFYARGARPQALATFYDVAEELKLLGRGAAATLDLPQHVESVVSRMYGRGWWKRRDPWATLRVVAENELEKLANLVGGVQVSSLHVHWWGPGIIGRPISHYPIPSDALELYQRLLERLAAAPGGALYVVTEMIPGGGGGFRDNPRRRRMLIASNVEWLISTILGLSG